MEWIQDILANLTDRWPIIGAILAVLFGPDIWRSRKALMGSVGSLFGKVSAKGGDPVLSGLDAAWQTCGIDDKAHAKLLQETKQFYETGLKSIEGAADA